MKSATRTRHCLLVTLLVACLYAQAASAQTVTYQYDDLGRLTSATYSDGTVISYAYDSVGNRTQSSVTAAAAPGSLQFAASTATVAEDASSVVLTVTRTGGSAGAASVGYSTAPETASAGSDFTTTSGTLQWGDGDDTGKTVTVSITDDTAAEADETFAVVLSSTTGASLGSPSSIAVTIEDNDTSSVPGVPTSISPPYNYAILSCAPGTECTDTSGGEGGIQVSWTPPSTGPSPHHYELQRATNSATFSANLTTVYSGPLLAYLATFPGTSGTNWYYFRVRACTEQNECSAWRQSSIWEVCAGFSCGGSSW